MEVAGTQEHDHVARIDICFLDGILREVEERLRQRAQDLLRRIVGLLLELHLGAGRHEVIAHDIDVGEASLSLLEHRSIDAIGFAELRYELVESIPREHISHSRTPLSWQESLPAYGWPDAFLAMHAG